MTVPNGVHTPSFADSNIWLYAFLDEQSDTKASIARRILGDSRPMLSVQVINEICRNLLQKGGLDEVRIRSIIKSFYAYYSVADLTQETLLLGSDLRTRYSFSFWDSLIVAAALQSGAQLLYSEDMQHGLVVDGSLRVVNPFLQE